jgi:hypothetical protein
MEYLYSAIKHDCLPLCIKLHESNKRVLRRLDVSYVNGSNNTNHDDDFCITEEIISEFKKFNIPIEKRKTYDEDVGEAEDEEDVEDVDDDHKTDYTEYDNPMLVAIYYDRLDICKWLYDINDDLIKVKEYEDIDTSPIYIAFHHERFDILKFIIEKDRSQMYLKDANDTIPFTFDLEYRDGLSFDQFKFIFSVDKNIIYKEICDAYYKLYPALKEYLYLIDPEAKKVNNIP